jgi:hypothetical protein
MLAGLCRATWPPPDRGQHTIASAQTCADFFYDEYPLAVFIDGPHT